MKRFGLPLLALIVGASILVPRAAATPQTDGVEVRLLQLINAGRATQSKAAEKMHAGLRSKTQGHSAYQSSINGLTHNGFSTRVTTATPDPAEANGAPDDGFPAGQACENVAYYYPGSAGATDEQVAQWFYNAWYNSTGHRNCLFDVWNIGMNAAGVGIYKDSRGYWWATFIATRDNSPPTGTTPPPPPPPTPTPPPVGTWTRVQQNGSGVVNSGSGWVTFNSASASGGSYQASVTAGNKSTYSFTGTGVRWISLYWTGGGIAQVRLDGALVATVDGYATSTSWQRVFFERTGLVNKAHTLEIYVTGTKRAASSGNNVYVDALEYRR